MSKELIENLLIEFDEMGFEPTTLCDTKKEIDSFRNRLKQVLDYLKAIDNANPSEALEKLLDGYSKGMAGRSYYDTIKQYIIKAQEQEKVLEILKSKDVLYTQIKYCKSVDEYNHLIEFTDFDNLAEEEFELLKQYFEKNIQKL